MIAFVGGFWFLLQIAHGNMDIVIDFIQYQIRLLTTEDSGHGGFLLYHFVILLVGVFPASLFAIMTLFRRNEKSDDSSLIRWMSILFWVVLILFTIVKTKIVHYSSLCYFPLSYFAALSVQKLLGERINWKSGLTAALIFLTFVFSLAIIGITYVGKNTEKVLAKVSLDDFTRANLSAKVHWSGLEMLIGVFFILSMVVVTILIKRKRNRIIGVFVSSLVFVYLTMIFITPRIEGYTQRAAIEFYKELKDEKVYLATLGFKSYAHLFYSDLKPYERGQNVTATWLLEGDIDRDAYFVFKINRKKRYLEEYPQLIYLYEKNGFVFTKRPKND